MKQISKQLPINKEQSLYFCIKDSSKKYSRRVAFYYMHRAFSYAHLIKRINQFAYKLTKLGVKKDEPVTMCLPNIPDALYLLYAINQIGAIANIVHPSCSLEQLDEYVTKTGSKYLFCLDTSYRTFRPLKDKGIYFVTCSPVSEFKEKIRKRYQKKFITMLNDDRAENIYLLPEYKEFDNRFKEDAIYLHSGGTLSTPKTIALSSFAINSLVANAGWFTCLDNFEDVGMLSTLPMFHGFGLCMGIHAPLCYGGHDVLMPKFSRYNAVKYIEHKKLNILIGVPILYESILSKGSFKGRKLRYLTNAFIGGDNVSPALIKRFNDRMIKAKAKCRLFEGYGLTEVVNVCSVNTHNFNKEGTVGKLFPNAIGVVIDEKGKELPPNQDGEICIGGESLMNGYRFMKEDKSVYHIDKNGNKYIKTGDIGMIDEDGYLYYKSRIKRIIKVSGVPVFPSEIEDVATSFDFVYEVAAIGVEDEKHGHIVKLFVKLSKTYHGSQKDALDKLNDKIVKTLGIYSKPKEIVFLDKMPHTVVGKIDTKLLK
ncbi:MAG: acyl--CoA ligase [Bacilli bacterium]|nr:acyl--CoA ligase [Bacilli bacterium]